MAAIGRNDYRAPRVPRRERVEVPECGTDAYTCVRELGAKDLAVLRETHGEQGDTADAGFVWHLLARTICDDEGVLLFTDEMGEPSPAIAEEAFGLSYKTLERLAGEALRIGGLRVQEKNSPPPSATT